MKYFFMFDVLFRYLLLNQKNNNSMEITVINEFIKRVKMGMPRSEAY